MRAFLLLVAFLLPLRVISAESIALSMTLGTVAATAQQATKQAMQMEPFMLMEDCPLMGKAEQSPGGMQGHQGNCQTCQICLAWATPSPLGCLPAVTPSALTLAPGEDFASVVLAPDLRPPIS